MDALFFACAVPAVILLGLSKGGFIGVGGLAVPLMALAVSPVASTAILLPIVIAQDVVGVWVWRRTWDAFVLKAMLPGAALGIFIGWLFAARVSADAVLALVGLLSILFGAQRLWLERGGRIAASSTSPAWIGTLFGTASGFCGQIALAGGPAYQMWVLPRRLDRDSFVGTTAIFFAIGNWLKVPAFVALGQFTARNLTATALLMPVAIVATFAGVRLVRRVPGGRFYRIVYALMILVGAKLLIDATS